MPGGIAAKSGKLRMGDRILKVNGTDVTKATHQEAVMELLRPGDSINLTVQHDPLPENYQVSQYNQRVFTIQLCCTLLRQTKVTFLFSMACNNQNKCTLLASQNNNLPNDCTRQ